MDDIPKNDQCANTTSCAARKPKRASFCVRIDDLNDDEAAIDALTEAVTRAMRAVGLPVAMDDKPTASTE